MKHIALWCCLVLIPAFASAAPVEDPASLEQLRKAAEAGDAEAMLELGILYEFGFRMPDNKPPALAWYRLAAESGSTKAGARQDALRGKMAGKELDEANKLYAEYSSTLRKPAPAKAPEQTPSASPPAAAPTPASTPAAAPK
jgi:TPR repeat protein